MRYAPVTKTRSRSQNARPTPPPAGLPHVVDDGLLDGDFEGFDEVGTIFVFVRSRRQWRQAERRLSPYYAYMPSAQVVRRDGRCYLEVRGMRDRVLVEEVAVV